MFVAIVCYLEEHTEPSCPIPVVLDCQITRGSVEFALREWVASIESGETLTVEQFCWNSAWGDLTLRTSSGEWLIVGFQAEDQKQLGL